MERSINQIRSELNDVADAHRQINKYFWGDFNDLEQEEAFDYPLMLCTLIPAEFTVRETVLDIQITIADLAKNKAVRDEVESDTLQIMKDVHSIMSLPRFRSIVTTRERERATFFHDKGGSNMAGWTMTVRMAIVDRRNKANIPLSGYDPNERY